VGGGRMGAWMGVRAVCLQCLIALLFLFLFYFRVVPEDGKCLFFEIVIFFVGVWFVGSGFGFGFIYFFLPFFLPFSSLFFPFFLFLFHFSSSLVRSDTRDAEWQA
jgi:hypothetical protein